MLAQRGLTRDIEVDGGIHAGTAAAAARAGANVLVAGSAIFGDPGGATAGMQVLRASLGA